MKKFLAILMAACMLLALAACGAPAATGTPAPDAPSAPPSENTGGDSGASSGGGKLKIALSSQHLTNDFNRGVLAGVTSQAEAMGVELVTANAQGDTNQQVADLENFLTMGVDAIIIGGGEGPAFANIMQQAADKGIPCITVDITSEFSTCNVTSDNFNGGEKLGLYVTNKLGGEGNILLLDTPGWHSLEIRIRMLESVIMDYDNLNVVQTISIGTQDAINNYYNEVKSYLMGNSDIDCVYCSWGLAAVGASQAIRELGLQDEIFVVCTDADQVVLEEMMTDDSPLTAVVGQYPDQLGSTAMEMAVKAASGESVAREVYAPIILTEKYDTAAWFSAPALMTPEETYKALYGSAA